MPFDGAAIRRGLLRGEARCDRAVIASPTDLPETDFPTSEHRENRPLFLTFDEPGLKCHRRFEIGRAFALCS
jgi:hypothetical protein